MTVARPLRRPPRPTAPELPSGNLQLRPPPPLRPPEGAGGLLMNLLPMLGSVGSIVLVATAPGHGGSARQLLSAGMFLFASLGFVLVQMSQQHSRRDQSVTGSRADYLRYLGGVRQTVRNAADQQRRALTWHHPEPSSLPALAEERSRLWERGASDPRFLQVRYGVCHQPLALELLPPEGSSVNQVDPASASALHRLLVVHRLQPDLPASLDLRAFGRVEICGPEEPARAAVRSLVCEATAFHSPQQLVVAVLTDDASRWDWVKWLPHGHSGRRTDAIGPQRMVAASLDDLVDLLPADLVDRPRFGADDRPSVPHLLLVVDGVEVPPDSHLLPADGVHGVTVVDLPARWDELTDASRVRLQLSEELSEQLSEEEVPDDAFAPALVVRARDAVVPAKVDQCDLATAEAFARRLAPLHLVSSSQEASSSELQGPTDFMELLGLPGVRSLEPEVAWRPRPARDRLRVPIGLGDNGSLVHLDLKEPAQQGMGPHGLVIGATGSGKSEFLRTLVLGLALTHSPEQLNLVLVDFKGGATFAGMSALPHVSAVITNLAQELTLVDRMQDALAGEMTRRQELLRDAGNFANLKDYERARSADPTMQPMPSLFLVVDEFSEMLSAKPEFIDLFVAIGRLGRSLGIHLLLASQRLEEGRLRGLESHLSYRVGLRTFSAQESRAALGVPDAYELPAAPGLGYLKPDPTSMVRFKAAYVSGPPTDRAAVRRADSGGVQGILPFTVAEVRALAPPVVEAPPVLDEPIAPRAHEPERSLLDVAVQRMQGHGVRAHRVWLPPLDVPDSLDRLMPLAVVPGLGLVSEAWRKVGPLVIPLGVVDKPREQRRDTMSVDLSGAAGHVAVVGGPRSGKSTLLRTIVTATALTSTPLESQVFVLDFGGGTFAPLTRLPHVAGVGTRSEPDVVRRIVAQVRGVVDRREAYFREHGIDSVETYRARRERGQADDGYGDVFLVVDGWGTLRADFDDLEIDIQQLAGRGLAFGLHLVTAATRWTDYRATVRDVFGTRLELRLGDPMDSEIDRKLAALVPTGRPGRGILAGKLHFLGALPRVDGRSDAGSLGDGVDDLIRRVAQAWQGPAGPKLRLLPEDLPLEQLRAQADLSSRRLWIGLNEADLAPVGLDADNEPHLLVFGDGQSGKSSLLRSLAREIMRTRMSAEAQIAIVDYRRSLLGEVPERYLLSYLTSATQATPAIAELANYLESRIPGPDVTPEQLRNRSWWKGAEVFVLVDDYDLVATQQGSPLHALQPLMAQARDIGLHLAVVRRSGGASRASYDPVIQAMRDLAQPGILLSGTPDEGALIGPMRPMPAPPGRGRLLTRERGIEVVQLARVDPVI